MPLATFYLIAEGQLAWLCGPVEDPTPWHHDLGFSQAGRLAEEALREPSHHAVLDSCRLPWTSWSLPFLDSAVSAR